MFSKEQITKKALNILWVVSRYYNPQYKRDLANLNIQINDRYRAVAGKACYNSHGLHTIILANSFFKQPENEKELKETVLHELAHILADCENARRFTPEKPHGRTWKRIYKEIGGTGKRCHDMSYKRNGHRQYSQVHSNRTSQN